MNHGNGIGPPRWIRSRISESSGEKLNKRESIEVGNLFNVADRQDRLKFPVAQVATS